MIDADTVIKQGCFKQYLFSILALYDSSVGQGCLKLTVMKVDALILEEENASLISKIDDMKDKGA